MLYNNIITKRFSYFYYADSFFKCSRVLIKSVSTFRKLEISEMLLIGSMIFLMNRTLQQKQLISMKIKMQ